MKAEEEATNFFRCTSHATPPPPLFYISNPATDGGRDREGQRERGREGGKDGQHGGKSEGVRWEGVRTERPSFYSH